MTPMQKDLYRGRTLACNNCAKTFSADELTPQPMETPRAWSPAAPAAAQAAPAAAAPQTSAPAAPTRRSSGWLTALLTFGAAVLVVGLLLALLLPPLNRAREQSRRIACANNMRQIGQAMMIYASANSGRFPDRLDRVLAYVGPAALVCPSTNHTAAPGQSPQAQSASLATPGHLSYVYVGETYTTAALVNAATTVVLYEPLSNHGDGTNVLYADGHVAYLAAGPALALIPGLASATPNPAGPTPAPVTQPSNPPATFPAAGG
jgi:prepilin-type processing-associated H-X9-DG protein